MENPAPGAIPGLVTAQLDGFYSNVLIITIHFYLLLMVKQVCKLSQYLIPVICLFRIAEVLLNGLIIRQRSPLTVFLDLPPIGHPVMSFDASLWQEISSLISSTPLKNANRKKYLTDLSLFSDSPWCLQYPLRKYLHITVLSKINKYINK